MTDSCFVCKHMAGFRLHCLVFTSFTCQLMFYQCHLSYHAPLFSSVSHYCFQSLLFHQCHLCPCDCLPYILSLWLLLVACSLCILSVSNPPSELSSQVYCQYCCMFVVKVSVESSQCSFAPSWVFAFCLSNKAAS